MKNNVIEVVKEYGERIDPLLESELSAEAYEFLSAGARYQLESGGKRLRPALCLLTCEGLREQYEKALPFACASEILHNVFLIHDDIEDGDRKRRNRNTLWVEYGIPNAINIGDFLAAKAYSILLKSDVDSVVLKRMVEVFTETYLITTQGQALDINLRADRDLSEEQYLKIVSLKTAKYLGYNFVGGALAAKAPEHVIASLWKAGGLLGPAFQIQDDLLDLTKGKGRGGEIGCDIKEGKPTIFLAHVLKHENAGSSSKTRKLLDILQKERDRTSKEEIEWVIDYYEQQGALAFARGKARQLIEQAIEQFTSLPLSNLTIFTDICHYVIERNV